MTSLVITISVCAVTEGDGACGCDLQRCRGDVTYRQFTPSSHAVPQGPKRLYRSPECLPEPLVLSSPDYEVEPAFMPPSRMSLRTDRAMKNAER